MPTPALQHVCDGCGATVAPEHVRDRITRLEWATRFRPLHIQRVLLAGAPPVALQDFFYMPEAKLEGASWGAHFFRAVMEGAGIAATGKTAEAMLAEFQRQGLYLAYAHECPQEHSPVSPAALAGIVERRLRFSYKPKSVLPLDELAYTVCTALMPAQLSGVDVRIPPNALQPPAAATGEWPAYSRAVATELRRA